MNQITNLVAGKGRGKRINIFLDGKFTLSLQATVALEEGLKVGQELSVRQLEALADADRFRRCLDAAMRYLGYRPRSEAEVRQRLKQRGFEIKHIDQAISRLKDNGVVDDVAFARFWKENRDSFSPRSQQLTRLELRQKGIDSEIAYQVAGEGSDEDNAYRAALSKTRRMTVTDYQVFRRRLGDYLRRRGFNYEVINRTVARVWQEGGHDSG